MNRKIHKLQRLLWNAVLIVGAVTIGSTANALDWSIQAFGGFATTISTFGTDDTVDKSTETTVEVDDFMGGSGAAAGFGVAFHDVLPWKDFDIGVQYIFTTTDSRSKSSIEVPANVLPPVTPTNAFSVIDTDTDIHTFFVNLAYSPTKGKWRPYLGVGLGGGIVDIDIDETTKLNTGVGSLGGDSNSNLDSPHLGIQAYFGFDYNIWKNLTLGLASNWYYINADIIDEDIEVSQLMILGSVGWTFK